MRTPAPVTFSRLGSARVDGMPTARGCLLAHLDDGRVVTLYQHDLLASIVDLAESRSVLDAGEAVLLDPLLPDFPPQTVILQVRSEPFGDEIGTRHTSRSALLLALGQGWRQVQRHANVSSDRALLLELTMPHSPHWRTEFLCPAPPAPQTEKRSTRST